MDRRFTFALIFVAAFGTLAISFWPYMFRFTITAKARRSKGQKLDAD
jgi:hypothetical protein